MTRSWSSIAPRREKTLIFFATDEHADRVVVLLKEALKAKFGAVDDDAVAKITGATDRPLEAIRRYRNERQPNIAVTVDLLTTGIDVPRIANPRRTRPPRPERRTRRGDAREAAWCERCQVEGFTEREPEASSQRAR